MENKSSEDRPPADLTLVFSPHPGKLGRRSLVHELVTQLGLDAGTGVIHMVSSDRLCNTAESAAETPTPHLQQSNNAAPSKDPLGHSETLHSLSAGEETMTEAVCEVLVGLCRHAGLLAPRASLVSLKEQHQALLLCLARQNKEVNGDFSADASELLAAWKIMKRDAFKAPARDKLDCKQVQLF
ncbi:hypothetical protein FHG87_008765 [Trinorchestia longiramus]|nr:hypothetical protein FHG87_008765 [Trinorchestia longiramus]